MKLRTQAIPGKEKVAHSSLTLIVDKFRFSVVASGGVKTLNVTKH